MAELPVLLTEHQNSLLQTVLESVDDAILVFDKEHKVVYANRAATKVFGREVNQLVGNDIKLLTPEDKRGHFESAVNALKASEHHSTELKGQQEFVGLRENGHNFYAAGRLLKLQGALSFMLVLQDITWKKMLEDQLEKALVHLKEVEDKTEYRLEHPSIMDVFPND